ncbi:hypothetical protein CDAR_110121 [Caerostris darwini]|uniref:Uncharacterized protein n=1 Tax=Caerostris darwini TaxID=1538125 RepID=A0AAV4P0E0_9ARAC|nr:hypothetical protein CDAR_110121 [Caerostris darwini]
MGLEENHFGGVSELDGGLRVAFGNTAQPFQEARRDSPDGHDDAFVCIHDEPLVGEGRLFCNLKCEQ